MNRLCSSFFEIDEEVDGDVCGIEIVDRRRWRATTKIPILYILSIHVSFSCEVQVWRRRLLDKL